MDVPESKFQSTDRSSPENTDGGTFGGHAANMFIPGALMSGCTSKLIGNEKRKTKLYGHANKT